MLAYKDAVETLYSYSVSEFTKLNNRSARIAARTKAATWGVTERDSDGADVDDNNDDQNIRPLLPVPGQEGESVLVGLRQRLADLQRDFRVRVNVLLGDLAYQPDTDMRFLGVVMNFNDVYRPVRRRRAGRDKDKERDKRREQVHAQTQRAADETVPGAEAGA